MNQAETAHAETIPDAEQARRELEEREKEIDCIHATLNPSLTEAASVAELFQRTVDLIPLAFREPDTICARVKVGESSFLTKDFCEGDWAAAQEIVVMGERIGAVEVHCRDNGSRTEGGTFPKGKRRFLEIVAARLGELVLRDLDQVELRKRSDEIQSKEELVERQYESIRNFTSIPVLEVLDKVLMLPITGLLDSTRAAELTEKLLSAISSRGARFVIVDVTGVEAIDTRTADYLLGLARSARLLGASYILTGIRPEVAQTMVHLGIEMSDIGSFATVQDGLKECLRQIGVIRVAGLLWASVF